MASDRSTVAPGLFPTRASVLVSADLKLGSVTGNAAPASHEQKEVDHGRRKKT